MKAIMVMFDSLNRHMLPPYGCDWVHAPNFTRLARRCVTFDQSYVCSMPCMPARRDLHTGRPNFLHRSWGPLEPFDDSMPQLLAKAGVYTHLATDHYHYFEDGGAGYHTRYNSWDFLRGQEGDPWIGQVAPPKEPQCVVQHRGAMWRQDLVNRQAMQYEHQQPQAKTFAAGLDFIRRNKEQDKWMLQLETFDPHEPFFTQQKYKDLYAEHYDRYRGKQFDWPPYREVRETAEEVEHCRHEAAALHSMCDAYLGEVMKLMDELDLWKDTMLIVWTDHGFLLGEHDCWAKNWSPYYDEVAHTPFFVWDPRCQKAGERRTSLVQPAIDLAPTLLEFFGAPIPKYMLGKSMRETIAGDKPMREAAMFGVHGGQANVTDGRYVYMRAAATPDNQPLFDYTLMPCHMRGPFDVQDFRAVELAEPFAFTKGCRTMKIRAGNIWSNPHPDLLKTHLWDLQSDPGQKHSVQDAAVERRMVTHLVRMMKECDAPAEQYERLGLAGGS